ncbi:DUF1684 domain-containing protein [uncultured Roseivirga sp.]|uniref:DUF1684 domain-containing protein n=1 Tax=uncultured Roseivirga sp. TaxID=543088 RepID=UPI000D78F158|nr:DUF1684 domain-containing protein [uncultured Roseivirga sp.]PWL31185.1 MAG: DUF1684 domain-containing protein [Roseivirga sp. XM-24bin3]
MKKSNLFILLIVAIVAITIFNFLTIGESSKDYTERLEQERKDKNGYMLSSNSPLIEEDKQNFTGLNYYPIDEEFKVTARIEKTNNKQPIFIESTTGEQLKYIPFATASFELKGQQHSVMLYQDWEEKDPNKLSLMFADETSAVETYGGGRYLDVMYRNTNSVIIDFNNAYNPFCHFNAEYSCPIPPRQNVMSIPIEAGEKIYKNH